MTLLPLFIRGWKQLSAYNKGTNTKISRWGRANVKRNIESVPCLFPLTTLLTEEQKELANIQDLSYDFACRIVRLYQYLIDTPSHNAKQNSQHVTEFIMSKQVYRSGTSIGANISEAQHAQSKADFLSKMTIASKEANETQYWLRLLHDNGYMNDAMFTSINKNMERILYKIIAIVKSTKENLNR